MVQDVHDTMETNVIAERDSMGPEAGDPTPDEIRRRSVLIRRRWSVSKRRRRKKRAHPGWVPPVCRRSDFGDADLDWSDNS